MLVRRGMKSRDSLLGALLTYSTRNRPTTVDLSRDSLFGVILADSNRNRLTRVDLSRDSFSGVILADSIRNRLTTGDFVVWCDSHQESTDDSRFES
jgi:DNA-binding TFAR19-related protein (PDSD5 family)